MTRRPQLIFRRLMGLCLAGAGGMVLMAGTDVVGVARDIDAGRWQRANEAIARGLARSDLSFAERTEWLFQQDRMRRMLLDFSKSRADVWREIRSRAPMVTEELFDRWEQEGAIECLRIDGTIRYFNRAAGNLFRVHPEAKDLSESSGSTASGLSEHRRRDLREILDYVARTGKSLTPPKTFRVQYTLTVKPGAVPRGEVIRAWLPYPQGGHRQSHARLLTAEPTAHLLTPSQRSALSCVYLEQPSQDPQPTVFAVEWTYRAAGFYQPIDPRRVRPIVAGPTLTPYLVERPPHIVFSDDLRELSAEIIGTETNPYLKARRIFAWVSGNIPWAGAREYSTLNSLTEYALRNRRGDCGIQTLLFMSLCRLNGIPARWESGWITGPDRNLHDWCAIYFEPYGWVPVDVSFGLVASDDERERWFYLGGTDRYRLVVNTDYGQEVYPLKTFFRSEIVDFQRGEVEWRGGNLYFDRWDYDFRVEELQP